MKYIEAFKSLKDETDNTYLNSPASKYNKAQEIRDIFEDITYIDFIVNDIKNY